MFLFGFVLGVLLVWLSTVILRDIERWERDNER